MFLSRPFLEGLPQQKVASRAADDFFQPGRRASQTHAQVRMLLHRKREVKLPFKPDRRSIHGCRRIKIVPSYKMPKQGEGTHFVAYFRLSEASSAANVFPAGAASGLRYPE